ncbi:hypothetical protein ACFLU6_11430 [Acidobacteriota bacterium]
MKCRIIAYCTLLVTLALSLGANSTAQTITTVIYAGGQSPGVVYRYDGGTTWTIVSPEIGNAVFDLIMFQDSLYASVQTHSKSHWRRDNSEGRVFRYEDDLTWVQVGGPLDSAAFVLSEYDGALYCGTSDLGKEARLYRLDGAHWTIVADTKRAPSQWAGFRASHTSSISGLNRIYLGDLNLDYFGYYQRVEGFAETAAFEGSCVWDIEEWESALWAGAYKGLLYRSVTGSDWTVYASAPDQGNVWAVQAFQGGLYLGVDGLKDYEANFYRFDMPGVFHSIWSMPMESKTSGVISMTTDGETLYFGTGISEGFYTGDGRAEVYSYNGTAVAKISEDDFFGGGVQCLLVTQIEEEEPPTCSAEAGESGEICEGETVILSGADSVACTEAGLRYRWLTGTTVMCGWSPSPTCLVSPSVTTVYTLEVECIDVPECVATDMVEIGVIPDIEPADIGNTVRAVRLGKRLEISWAGVPGAQTYALYRDTCKGRILAYPYREDLDQTSIVLPDVPGPPYLYLYLLTGVSCSGIEGP